MNIRDIESRLLEGTLKVRYHNGVGFMQAYLTEDVRLHVWHPGLPGELEAFGNRHDHRFDMTSTVLMGKLSDTWFDPLDSAGYFDKYRVMPAHLGAEMPTRIESRCAYEIDAPSIYLPGMEYSIPQGQFHESRAEDLTVTVMRKSNQSDDWARILATPGQVPEHGMSRKPKQALLDQLFFSALRKLPIEANAIIEAYTREP